jgi:2-methylcitrate dehydratase PrpD
MVIALEATQTIVSQRGNYCQGLAFLEERAAVLQEARKLVPKLDVRAGDPDAADGVRLLLNPNGRAIASARRWSMGATADLAAFTVDLRDHQITAKARMEVRRAMTDLLGVALAGSVEDASRIAGEFVRREASAGPAVVIGRGFRASPTMAALANGTTAHALDFDDIGLEIGHPSVAVIPSALAVAEAVAATGRELVDALVVGYEVASRLGTAAGGVDGPYRRGFHGTAVYGVFGATAAAARLLRLDVDQVRQAFGIAASEAGGVRANFGTMTKPLHAGETNRAGVLAAMLAGDGFSASRDAIEGRYGWGDAIASGSYDEAALTKGLGEGFAIEDGVDVKQYPCCGGNHAAINLIRRVIADEGVQPADIVSVEIDQSRYVAKEILLYPWPSTGLEGKFSLAYNVAEACERGNVTIDSFGSSRVDELEPWRGKVKVRDMEGRPPVAVRIHLAGGRVVTGVQPSGSGNQRGGHSDPLSVDEIKDKFCQNVERAGRGAQAPAMLDLLERLDVLGSLTPLTDLLA